MKAFYWFKQYFPLVTKVILTGQVCFPTHNVPRAMAIAVITGPVLCRNHRILDISICLTSGCFLCTLIGYSDLGWYLVFTSQHFSRFRVQVLHHFSEEKELFGAGLYILGMYTSSFLPLHDNLLSKYIF